MVKNGLINYQLTLLTDNFYQLSVMVCHGTEDTKKTLIPLVMRVNDHYFIYLFLNKVLLEKNRTTMYTGKRAQKFN